MGLLACPYIPLDNLKKCRYVHWLGVSEIRVMGVIMRSKVLALAVALHLILDVSAAVSQTANVAIMSPAASAVPSAQVVTCNALVNPDPEQSTVGSDNETDARETLGDGPTRDPSAIAILRQVLLASVGEQPQKMPTFSAQGTITYFKAKDKVDAPMMIKARGIFDFTLIAKLPEGERRLVLNRNAGEYTETNGKRRSIPFLSAINSAIPVVPQLWFSVAIADEQVSVIDEGEKALNGRQVRVVRIQPKVFESDGGAIGSLVHKDFYVDVENLQIRQIVDNWHPNESALQSAEQIVEFSEYSSMAGIIAPARILLKMRGNPVAELRITELSLNQPIDDSNFQIGK